MPFTPLHLGPALVLGYVFKRRLHWPTFIIANLIVDIEPLLVFTGLLKDYPLHGYLHTFLASLIAGSLLGYGMFYVDGFLRTYFKGLALMGEDREDLCNYILAGVLGWMLHVLLDAPLYYDIKPLYPILTNPFLIGQDYVHLYLNLTFLTLLAGVITYLINLFKVNSSIYGLPQKLMQVGASLILASILLLSTFNPLSFPTSIAVTTCGLILLYTAMTYLIKQRKRRTITSLACMLVALSIITLKFTYLRITYNDVELFLTTLVNDWLLSMLLPWVMVLIGLLLLYHPVRDLARELNSKSFLHIYIALVMGWTLTIVVIGIFVFTTALFLILLEVTKTRSTASVEWHAKNFSGM